jgi:ubiquinone biosynthesis protein
VCEPYFGRPISEISLGQVLMRLFDVSREFNVSVQPQLVLLQKTLLNVEGMGRVLDPDLDLWQTAKPFLERWMRDTLGIKGVMRQIKRELPFIARHLPQMPRGILKYVQNPAHSDEYLSRIQELEARLARQEQRFRWSCVYGFGMLLLFIFLLKIVFDWMV